MNNFILDRKSTVDDAIEYARKVVNGDLVAAEYIKKQAANFLEDIEKKQFESGFRWKFDAGLASHVINYCQLLNFVEGAQAGTNIILQPWQSFLLANLYGWVDKQDIEIRRFTRAIVLVARGSGKSTLLGALALYELIYAPMGSQIVTIATKKEQAELVWDMSDQMQRTSDPRLTPGYKKLTNKISNTEKWNRYTALSNKSERQDGLAVRLGIADESAAIKDDNLFNVVLSSMSKPKSPQFIHITTGQPGAENGFFYGQLDYAKKVLDGILEDERIFCLAYQIDAGDDWQDITNVIKAQPNLGVSASIEYYKEHLEQAKVIQSIAANYRTKYLNEFISTTDSWIDINSWNKNKGKVDKTLPCYLGLDLGATDDLVAVSAAYGPDSSGRFHFDSTCFVPEAAFREAPKHVRPIYAAGVESGKLVVTEGEVRDDAAIREYIRKLSQTHEIREICYDDWSALTLVNQLQEDGYEMVNIPQNMKALSPITKEVEIKVKNGEVIHDGDAFLAWQLSNCEVYTDLNENIKVRKGRDRACKIDAIIAFLMAMTRANINKPVFEPGFYFG